MKQFRTHFIVSVSLFSAATLLACIFIYRLHHGGPKAPSWLMWVNFGLGLCAAAHLFWMLTEHAVAAATNPVKPPSSRAKAKVTLTLSDVERGIEIRGTFEPPRDRGKETPAQMLAIMAIDHIEREMSAAAFDADAKSIIHREGI